MATSSNAHIQQLMNDVDAIDGNDDDLEAKLQKIAEAVAAEQQKLQGNATSSSRVADVPVDPADAFACEGCQ